MCGIVGVYGENINSKTEEIFTHLLYSDTIRGEDSTGIMIINKHSEVNVVKKDWPAHDFIGHNKYITAFYKVNTARTRALIGHNRAATRGKISLENAHPFSHGNITGVHNGTLSSNWKHVLKEGNKFEVDSDCIIHNLSLEDDPVNVLEKLDGAYALVWFDSNTSTIYMTRNNERPLSFCNAPDGNVYFASESLMLNWILKRNNINVKKYHSLNPGVLYSYNIKSRKVKTKKYKVKKGLEKRFIYSNRPNIYKICKFRNVFMTNNEKIYTGFSESGEPVRYKTKVPLNLNSRYNCKVSKKSDNKDNFLTLSEVFLIGEPKDNKHTCEVCGKNKEKDEMSFTYTNDKKGMCLTCVCENRTKGYNTQELYSV